MLLFSTLLDINDTLTKDAFIQLVIKWNQGSPHAENIIPGIVWNGERNIRYGTDGLWLDIEEYRNENIIAIRYEKTEDDGVVWDTDYVVNFNEMKMSVRLDRSYLEDALTIDSSFSTPAFIALLIDGKYLKDDGRLPIDRYPVFINESNVSLLSDVINGTTRYQLPIVYISKTFDEDYPVDIREISKRLKGVAHVLVQENAQSGSSIRQMTDSKNEYNGAIGIYFSNQTVGHEKFLKHWYNGSEAIMAEKVTRRIIQYSNSHKMDMLYTWLGVNNALLRDRYSSKKEELAASVNALRAAQYAAKLQENKADAEVEQMRRQMERSNAVAQESQDLVESVDDEIKSMRNTINDLTRQNEALDQEVQGLRRKLDGMSAVPILYLGSEDELFHGEIKEFILEALANQLEGTEAQTRRSDVLGDIIRSNGDVTGLPEEKKKIVKDTLFGYTGMTKPVRTQLKDLGFEITEEGKHYKLVYYGDGRYWITLDKTPSDSVHGGRNAALQIIKDML
ncbi:MAG TPA: hypothetical protein PLN48_10700 [Lachnospiraceae bacterium]|nr:hypothetical protein [Lachnospiraceae bacterium]